jgi:hypothetical protein
MSMRKSSGIALALFASLALLAAGCGGKQQAAGSSSAAPLVRADVLAFGGIDTDFGSSQWKQLDALSKKFPGRDKAIESIKKDIAGEGVDFDKDIKPALGPELDYAVAAGSTVNDTTAVGLLQPADEGKFKDLVDKENQAQPDSKTVYRKLNDGWYALGDTQADIDKVLKGDGAALSGESLYKDAVAKQPSDAVARVYVNGPELAKLVQKAIEARGNGTADSTTTALQNLDFISAAVSAEDDGVRLHGATQGSGSGSILGGGDYTSKLLDETPSDAFAFLTFKGGGNLGSSLGSLSAPLQLPLGVSLQDVLALFENESGLYVRPGAVIPEFAAILGPSDTAKGMATLTTLAGAVLASGATLSGGAEKTLSFGTQFAVHFGVKDGKIVITNSAGGISQVGSPSESLADSADFKEAVDAAGLPDSNGGFFYFDLKNTIPLIEGFAGLAGTKIPTEVSENLRPLRSFLSWSAGSGSSRTFDAFLEIK